jgi:NADH-quinone oxidoreductase subunit G
MTTTPERTEVETVTLTIDGVQVSVPKDTLVIRAAEQVGVQIPRFCDHPLLDPVGACRQCLVDIPDAGNGRGFPKPQASCTLPVAEGMVVNTQATSEVADKAQQGVMEFLLINHPLDCPVCDKGGECPLQNQAMSNGRGESRFNESGGVKRTFPKPINISAQVRSNRSRSTSASPSRATSPATRSRSARWARSPRPTTASARGPSTWSPRRAWPSTTPAAPRSASTTAAAR